VVDGFGTESASKEKEWSRPLLPVPPTPAIRGSVLAGVSAPWTTLAARRFVLACGRPLGGMDDWIIMGNTGQTQRRGAYYTLFRTSDCRSVVLTQFTDFAAAPAGPERWRGPEQIRHLRPYARAPARCVRPQTARRIPEASRRPAAPAHRHPRGRSWSQRRPAGSVTSLENPTKRRDARRGCVVPTAPRLCARRIGGGLAADSR